METALVLALEERLVEVLPRDQLEVGALAVGVAHHHAGGDLGAWHYLHLAGTPSLHVDGRDLVTQQQGPTIVGERPGEGVGELLKPPTGT